MVFYSRFNYYYYWITNLFFFKNIKKNKIGKYWIFSNLVKLSLYKYIQYINLYTIFYNKKLSLKRLLFYFLVRTTNYYNVLRTTFRHRYSIKSRLFIHTYYLKSLWFIVKSICFFLRMQCIFFKYWFILLFDNIVGTLHIYYRNDIKNLIYLMFNKSLMKRKYYSVFLNIKSICDSYFRSLRLDANAGAKNESLRYVDTTDYSYYQLDLFFSTTYRLSVDTIKFIYHYYKDSLKLCTFFDLFKLLDRKLDMYLSNWFCLSKKDIDWIIMNRLISVNGRTINNVYYFFFFFDIVSYCQVSTYYSTVSNLDWFFSFIEKKWFYYIYFFSSICIFNWLNNLNLLAIKNLNSTFYKHLFNIIYIDICLVDVQYFYTVATDIHQSVLYIIEPFTFYLNSIKVTDYYYFSILQTNLYISKHISCSIEIVDYNSLLFIYFLNSYSFYYKMVFNKLLLLLKIDYFFFQFLYTISDYKSDDFEIQMLFYSRNNIIHYCFNNYLLKLKVDNYIFNSYFENIYLMSNTLYSFFFEEYFLSTDIFFEQTNWFGLDWLYVTNKLKRQICITSHSDYDFSYNELELFDYVYVNTHSFCTKNTEFNTISYFKNKIVDSDDTYTSYNLNYCFFSLALDTYDLKLKNSFSLFFNNLYIFNWLNGRQYLSINFFNSLVLHYSYRSIIFYEKSFLILDLPKKNIYSLMSSRWVHTINMELLSSYFLDKYF